MEQLTLLPAEALAKISQSQENGQDFMETVLHWHGNFAEFYLKFSQSGSCGKTFPEYCRQTEDGIFMPFSGKWKTSGMAWHGEYWTHSISEFPKDAAESSLSDILETGDHLQQFYLSPKACQGILKRAKENNVTLPEILEQALSRQCQEIFPLQI